MVYVELGGFPLYLTRKLRILKYWLKVRQSNIIVMTTLLRITIVRRSSKNSNSGLGQMWDELILGQ